MAESLDAQPLEQVARVPADVIYRIFDRNLSIRKNQGLIDMLELVHHEARKRLAAQRA